MSRSHSTNEPESHTRTVLITGATAGIGRHAALHLARRGFHVFATGRRTEALESLLAEARGAMVDAFELDVTDGDSIAAAVAVVDRRTGGYGLDVLVNNAGYGLVGPLELIPDAELRRQFDTNVFGLMSVTRAFLPRMRERGSGRIINVSSVGGRLTFPFFGAYNASKYAIEALSDALRIELKAAGIDVVLLEPGGIKSEFSERAMTLLSAHADPNSPYAGSLARADRIRTFFDSTAVGPGSTSAAIERAITSTSPAARYVAPLVTYLQLWLFALMPTWLMDSILRAAMGLR
jgi:NAD(P)-dependent dehydrogenase (short-subunit alcohol dehydrogenase family)